MTHSKLLNLRNWIHLRISISWNDLLFAMINTIQINWERVFEYESKLLKTFFLKMIIMTIVAVASTIIIQLEITKKKV